MRKFQLWGLMMAGIMTVTLLSSTAALAHETRPVVGGKYTLRVGFINEPTFQGLENGLELTVCTGTCTTSKDGLGTLTNGVAGAFDTLKAEVIVGSQNMSLTLIPVPRQPGRFDAPFVPTRMGDYTFHIYGKINDDPIDERFTSGPDTFDPVQPLTSAQFPDKPGYNSSAAPGTTAPTVNATTAAGITPLPVTNPATPLLTSTTPPVNSAQVQDLQGQLVAQKQQLDEAKASASSASTLAFIGIGLGLVGLIVAGIALFSRTANGEPERG